MKASQLGALHSFACHYSLFPFLSFSSYSPHVKFFPDHERPLHSPSLDVYLPNGAESCRTQQEMEHRETQIASHKDKLMEYNENHPTTQEKELEILRPIMDEIHNKTCAFQHEMACRWADYTSRMSSNQP